MQRYRGLAAAAAVYAGSANAATIKHCPSGDVCFSVGVPGMTASSGSGNIYFQISAPTSYEWVALGTGAQMAGANIFLMYQDGLGNVTVSPRRSSGYAMPQYDAGSASALELLSGSGVSGGIMTANVRCANCQTWSGGGALDTASTGVPWIGAWKEGRPLASTSLSERISIHDGHSQFSIDMTQATVDTDSNPFHGAEATAPGTTGAGPSAAGVSVKTSNEKIIWAHGLGMAIAFAVLYPLGSALMPLISKWYIHGGVQMVSWLLMWAAFGLGLYGAQKQNMLFNNTHSLLGTVVVALLAIQPALGWVHHRRYVKTGSRGNVSYGHIWWGRILMVLGVVNGGLGLQLSNAKSELIIAYSVVAAVMYLVYAAVKTMASIRNKPRKTGDGFRRKESGTGPAGYSSAASP